MPIIEEHTRAFDPGTMNDDSLKGEILKFRQLLDKRRMVPNDANAIIDHLTRLEGEKQKRETSAKESEDRARIEGILSGTDTTGGGGISDAEIASGADRSRQSIEDIFNTARASGEGSINRQFAGERGRAIDEASAAGLR